ncbi:MAG: hypothetical protein PHN88_07355 [Ignavibacteria bacterium]|nr:hypothetical protein [Ignavibacteria bacterium]
MLKLILLFLFFPLSAFCQNIIPHASITEESDYLTSSDYRLFKATISPGYKDHGYRIDILEPDGKIYYSAEIGVNLIVHKKNYKMPDSNKEEWDYETEIKSNDIINDDTINVADCSNTRHLSVYIRLNKSTKYKIKIYHTEYSLFEHLLTYEVK